MPLDHSEWSASGFERVMLCPGSKALCAGAARTTSSYAAEGTAAHEVLTMALKSGKDAVAYLGRVIEADGFKFEVDEDMARHVQSCVDYVRDIQPDLLLVDRRVDYSVYLGLPPGTAWGTLDVAAVKGDELIVLDYKHGAGVAVDVWNEARGINPQLALYGLGALAEAPVWVEAADLEPITRVRLVISQPRAAAGPAEHDLSAPDLVNWAATAAEPAIDRARQALAASNDGAPLDGFLSPGEKQCRFCAAKATCPALRNAVADTVMLSAAGPEDFVASPVPSADHIAPTEAAWLAASLSKVDLIEDWCKAVRAEVERRLLAGQAVPGFKLVAGKRGSRAWLDPEQATKLLRETFRLPVEKAFDLKLISPTSAEKLFKAGDIGPRQWPKAQALIFQPEGKPHVAPESDKRPALASTADDFTPAGADLA